MWNYIKILFWVCWGALIISAIYIHVNRAMDKPPEDTLMKIVEKKNLENGKVYPTPGWAKPNQKYVVGGEPLQVWRVVDEDHAEFVGYVVK